MADEKHRGLAERVAEIMRNKLRLVSVDGEPCEQCGEIVDYSFKVKNGCLEKCANSIAELVFYAIANGNISVETANIEDPGRPVPHHGSGP